MTATPTQKLKEINQLLDMFHQGEDEDGRYVNASDILMRIERTLGRNV